ncbi:CubicO group peptidase, beta-lactamase class C family [Mucilaginibacter sp. OK268]|nr:CubicO group peptidase, beta-lactamase class C family [Mucilaginibacter sp. OK268]
MGITVAYMKSTIFSGALALVSIVGLTTCGRISDTAEKIQQVENNLTTVIQSENDGTYNLKDRMTYYHIHGVSIAIIHNYKIEWAKGYGWADDSLKIPVTTQTLFQAGSISKSLNSVGVLKLAQDKKIDLYTDINTYLRSWKFPHAPLSKGKKLTIANLLSHTGGLTVHGFGGYEKGDAIPTILQVLDGKKPANSPAVRSMYEPGLKYEYSGGGITISQLIVMDITHEPYEKFMYDNVLKPLGMTASTYQQPPTDKAPKLVSAAYYSDGKQVKGKYHIYPEQAAAGLWTNPTDLCKYIIETQLAYMGKSHKVLSQQMTNLMLTPYANESAALGVFIDSYPDSTKYFEHGGVDEGFISQYYGSIEDGNGLVIMVNTANGGNLIPEIVNSIAKVYGFKYLNHSKTIKTVDVPDSVLQNYSGQYELEPRYILTISKEDGNLFVQATGQEKVEIFPESESKFFLKIVDAEIEFIKGDKGQITKLILNQNGIHDAKKVK